VYPKKAAPTEKNQKAFWGAEGFFVVNVEIQEGFSAVYTVLFDLYHQLYGRTNEHFSFAPILSEPRLISAGFQ